jgi:AraC-like DNA-binding protein
VRNNTRPIQITVAASDPILLAGAHGDLALTSGDRATRGAGFCGGAREPISLGKLAAATGYSMFHACRVFRGTTGNTIHGFRRELRLRHALARILDGNEPLAGIALPIGFASYSHLDQPSFTRGSASRRPGRAAAPAAAPWRASTPRRTGSPRSQSEPVGRSAQETAYTRTRRGGRADGHRGRARRRTTGACAASSPRRTRSPRQTIASW